MTESKKRQRVTRKKSRKEGGGGCISTGKGKSVCPDDITVAKQALSELEAEMKKGGKRKAQKTRRHKK